MKIRRLHVWLFFFTGSLLLIQFTCADREEKSHPGERLARQYCQACHRVPDPAELAKGTWEEILPLMSAKMGINVSPAALEHSQLLRANDLQPETPMLTPGEWLEIKAWYLENSPDSLEYMQTQIDSSLIEWFIPHPIQIGGSQPAASLVQFSSAPGHFYYGDAAKNKVYEYSLNNSEMRDYQLDGAPSSLLEEDDQLVILTMGNIHPNDKQQGRLYSRAGEKTEVRIDSLSRPVHVSSADLNGDGRTDYVISGFGYLKGELSWFEAAGTDSLYYQKHVLRPLPGAIKTSVTDLDRDGNLDILALMAQGDEGFFLYKGDGKGHFTEERLISFPPSFGSSYYELNDINGDGYEDIIYTNGDNGDYSHPVLKPYHGVHIYIRRNTTPLSFEEEYFFPMHGPFKAMAEDYNLDGHPDIACISYFPDYERTPEESFLILVNSGSDRLAFTAHAIPSSPDGKWLTADRADYDQDGDMDILLGNGPIMSLYVPDSIKNEWKKKPVTVLLLENTHH